MMLHDRFIRACLKEKRIEIDPPPLDSAIQPASVDLTLGGEFLSLHSERPILRDSFFDLEPGGCILGTTAERIVLPRWLVGRVEGKSTWGRRFLMVHSTAGFIDPGFRGQITLELKNLTLDMPIRLHVGKPIAQISFQQLISEPERAYGDPGLGSHYQDQVGVTAAAQ